MTAPAPGPGLAVAVALGRAGGRALLIRRAPGRPAPGFWAPVTGRVDPGETLALAARREALEEVGLAITVGPEIFRGPAEGAPFVIAYLHCALGPGVDPDHLVLQADEVAEARWVTREEAMTIEPMLGATRRFYAEVFPWGNG